MATKDIKSDTLMKDEKSVFPDDLSKIRRHSSSNKLAEKLDLLSHDYQKKVQEARSTAQAPLRNQATSEELVSFAHRMHICPDSDKPDTDIGNPQPNSIQGQP